MVDQGSAQITSWDPGKLELEAISVQSHLRAPCSPETRSHLWLRSHPPWQAPDDSCQGLNLHFWLRLAGAGVSWADTLCFGSYSNGPPFSENLPT